MTLFHYRGAPVRLHGSFLVVATMLVGWELLSAGMGAAAVMLALGTAIFGSVLLHELGHAEAARRFGIRTRSVTLYPFGGIAALESEPMQPRVELAVALAGPAVNAVLAIVAFGALSLGVPGAGWVLGVNVAMGLFNLVPAFPMDGGRVLRAFWASSHGLVDATLRALRVSRVLAWAFVALGIFWSPSLALVGGFVLLANRAERARWEAVARRMRWDVPRGPGHAFFAHPVAGRRTV